MRWWFKVRKHGYLATVTTRRNPSLLSLKHCPPSFCLPFKKGGKFTIITNAIQTVLYVLYSGLNKSTFIFLALSWKKVFYCRSIYGIVNICKEEETNKGSKDRQFCYLFGHNLGQLFGSLLAEECVMERENNQRRRIRSATKERTTKHLKRSVVEPVQIFGF